MAVTAESYFDACWEHFSSLWCNASEPSEICLQLGRVQLVLQFVNPSLVPYILPALQHLRLATPNSEQHLGPTLTVGLWDAASTGLALNPPTHEAEDFKSLGLVEKFSNDQIQLTYDIGSGVLNLLNRNKSQAIFWVNTAAALPYYERGAPLRSLLATWLQDHGYQLVHAAAVATEHGAVILAGRGGSGKSTSALGCLVRGLRYLSDDYCVVAPAEQNEVFSLYCSAKVVPDSFEKFPWLEKLKRGSNWSEHEKILFLLGDSHADQILNKAPLRAILLPQQNAQEHNVQEAAKITQASAIQGLRSLSPSTIFQLPASGARAFQSMSQLVRTTPVHQFHLGSRPEAVPEAIEHFLEHSAA